MWIKLISGWIACQALLCMAQVSSVVSLSNGIRLRISATGLDDLTAALSRASGNSFYRIFRDEDGLAIFAYEVAVARTPDGEQFRITARPAGEDFAARFPNADIGKPVPTLSAPRESPLLSSGEKFPIEIPSNPGASSHVIDTIEVRLNRPGAAAVNSTEIPQDGLRFSGLTVLINGKPVSPAQPGVVVAGRFAMFYVPGRGAYFFSAAPVDGRPFLEAGWAEGARMQLTLENESIDCTAGSNILSTSGRGQIWAYHDPNYQPEGNWTKNVTSSGPNREAKDEFFVAASDSLQWWLP